MKTVLELTTNENAMSIDVYYTQHTRMLQPFPPYTIRLARVLRTWVNKAISNFMSVLFTNIGKTLMSSLHGLLNCKIDGLDCHVSTTEYRTRVH